MGYIPHHLKIANNILYKICRTNMISYANSANSDTREVGLQIANFQERQKKYKQYKARQEIIKNQTWLG